ALDPLARPGLLSGVQPWHRSLRHRPDRAGAVHFQRSDRQAELGFHPMSARAPDHPSDAPALSVSLRQATRVWAKVGLMSFGGPAGQIAVMHRELVETRRWISDARFLHALNYCMLLPGPEAAQLAIYIGWMLHRTLGGLIAGLLFVLPGFVTILALSIVYTLYGQVPWIVAMFFGLKAAVLAVVIEAVLRIGRKAI